MIYQCLSWCRSRTGSDTPTRNSHVNWSKGDKHIQNDNPPNNREVCDNQEAWQFLSYLWSGISMPFAILNSLWKCETFWVDNEKLRDFGDSHFETHVDSVRYLNNTDAICEISQFGEGMLNYATSWILDVSRALRRSNFQHKGSLWIQIFSQANAQFLSKQNCLETIDTEHSHIDIILWKLPFSFLNHDISQNWIPITNTLSKGDSLFEFRSFSKGKLF
jgi:hypothetical protein